MIPPALEQRTIPGLLRERVAGGPADPFLIDDEGVWTWSEVFEAATRVAGGLVALGVERGDRVAIMAENGRELLLAWFGTSLLGAVEVPVNPAERGPRLHHQLHHSRARVIVVGEAQVEEVLALDLPEPSTSWSSVRHRARRRPRRRPKRRGFAPGRSRTCVQRTSTTSCSTWALRIPPP